MYSSHQSNSEKESTSHTSSTRKQAHNRTGIPDQVKAKYEQHSGYSLDDVRIHYNSGMPAQFHAFAFTQGNNVYIGPQQEGYLNHELGHVVQQKQGRVPVESYYNGVAINEDSALEREADNFLSYAPVRRQGEIQDNNTFADNLTFSSNLGNNGGIYDSGIMQCKYFMRALPNEESFPLEVRGLKSKDKIAKKSNELLTDDVLKEMVQLRLKSGAIQEGETEETLLSDLKKDLIKAVTLNRYIDGLAGISTSVYCPGGTYIYPVGYMLDINEPGSVLANYTTDGRTASKNLTQYGPEIMKKFLPIIINDKTLNVEFQKISKSVLLYEMTVSDCEGAANAVTYSWDNIFIPFIKKCSDKYKSSIGSETDREVFGNFLSNLYVEYGTVLSKAYHEEGERQNKALKAAQKNETYKNPGLANYDTIVETVKQNKGENSYSESLIIANIESVCCVWYDDIHYYEFKDRPIEPNWKIDITFDDPYVELREKYCMDEAKKGRLKSAEKLATLLNEGKQNVVKVAPLSEL